MELREAIRRRRMVRRFDPRPVPAELLDRVLESALHAPSAGFSQGLDLLVLQGAEAVAGFWRTTADPAREQPYSTAEPAAIVLVLSNRQAYLDRYAAPDKAGLGMDVEAGWPLPYWDLDAAMAAMLLLLAAVDAGLGGWFLGVFHGEAELLAGLGVPPGHRLIGAVALGWPAADDRPSGSPRTRRRRTLAEIVHYGRW
ncbi:MAG TPA: nitroreductase family protein [Actinomycetes bacterium]|jgi:nitroreductase|nr:nitroreductase family protein [Actinomycetes bacterium]